MKKNQIWNAGFMVAVLIFCLSNVASGQLVEELENGKIDWEEGYVYGVAVGSADMSKMKSDAQAEEVAKRTAKLLAARNILETIEGIRLDSKTILRMANEEDDILKAESEGVVKEAVVSHQSVSWVQGSKGREPRASITLRVPINGNLTHAVSGWSEREKKTESAPAVYEIKAETPPAKYTGLIIDASGKSLKPVMSPKILVDDGKTKKMVYGPGLADSSVAMIKGLAGYAGSLENARKNERAGNNPLVITARKADGVYGGDVVVSEEDAKKIKAADKDENLLKSCKVVIIVN